MTQSPYLRCTSPPICRPGFPAVLVNRDLNLLQGQRSSQSIPPPLRRTSPLPPGNPAPVLQGAAECSWELSWTEFGRVRPGCTLRHRANECRTHTRICGSSAVYQDRVAAAQEDRSGAHTCPEPQLVVRGRDLNWEGHHPQTSLSDIWQRYNV